MKVRNKAHEAAKGGPLGNECNAVAELHGRSPPGSSLIAAKARRIEAAWAAPGK